MQYERSERAKQFDNYAEQIDKMNVDQVLRFKGTPKPSRTWAYHRGMLNNFEFKIMYRGDDLILVRLR